MKILKDLISKMHDTMDEVEWYAEKAHILRETHKELADTYIKVAEMHVDIYRMLHDQAAALIEAEKKKGVDVPPAMYAVWEYEHERLIKELAETKILLAEYKKY
jgi:hypothetical protein